MKVFTIYLKVFMKRLYCWLVNVVLKLNIYLNKYYSLYILSLILILGILVFLLELLYSGNVVYCDSFDNDFIRPVERDAVELEGRPINYEPYHPGLQPTSQGYRYELGGSPRKLPAELDGRNISKSGRIHGLHGPSAYKPSYKAAPNSRPRIMVDDYYDLPSNQSISNSRVSNTVDRVNINPVDSEFYRKSYITSPLHDTKHVVKESVIKKAKKSMKKFVDWAKEDIANTRRRIDEIDRIEAIRDARLAQERHIRRMAEAARLDRLYRETYGKSRK